MLATEVHQIPMSGLQPNIAEGLTGDAVLLKRYFSAGDAGAMDELFQRHAGTAYRLALANLENAADAEEAVQTAFLQILSKGQKADIANVRGWIMRIVIDSCRDKTKEEIRRRKRQVEAARDRSTAVEPNSEKSEKVAAAVSAIKALPKKYRLPVWLHHLEGLTFKEVGCALSLPEDTVAQQTSRGIEQVRQSMTSAGFTASMAAMPALLASATLPPAPVALTASFKTLIAGGAVKTSGIATGMAAAKGTIAAKLTIIATLAVVSAASVAIAVHVAKNPGAAVVAPVVPHDSNETKGDDKGPAPASASAWPEGKSIGWRGDGTGVYANATPPTSWSRSEAGEKKNIVWETKLPCYSWATPLVIGEKIFVRSEPYDLVCLNKKDGKILWVRSHGPFTAIGDDEKKANPAFNDIAPLVAKLNAANDAYVVSGSTPALLKEKHDLQKQINDALGKIDKKYKLPPDMWNESWGGYTGSTPCTDGKFIYFNSGSGVTACYDLDGNKKWSRYERIPDNMWSEHGQAVSPAVVGDKLLVPQNVAGYELIALNKTTGVQIWHQSYKPAGTAYEVLPFQAGGVDYVFAWCNLIRVSDGKSMFAGKPEVAIGAGAVIHGNELYYMYGAPGVVGYKFDPKANGELQVAPPLFNDAGGNGFLPLPVEASESGDSGIVPRSYVPSPLFHDGLLYLLSNGGKLVVIDPKKNNAKDAIIYTKFLPFDLKNPKHRHTWGCGICASPAAAGKYIYLMDNAGCSIVIEPGREYKQVAKNNINYKLPQGWEENHWDGPREEVTLSTPIFDGNRIYLRGEQNLYCIGEK